MAKLIRRTWTVRGLRGERVKRVAYGYSLMVNGKQERKVSGDWVTETDALEALAKRQREVGAGILERPERTLGEVAKEYLRYKAESGKRTVDSDRRILNGRLLPALGSGRALRTVTAPVVAQYEKGRLGAKQRGAGER
jgi:hypothetical protein